MSFGSKEHNGEAGLFFAFLILCFFSILCNIGKKEQNCSAQDTKERGLYKKMGKK